MEVYCEGKFEWDRRGNEDEKSNKHQQPIHTYIHTYKFLRQLIC